MVKNFLGKKIFKNELLQATALLLVLLVIFFHEAIFTDKVYSQAGNLYIFKPWEEYTPQDLGPQNYSLMDRSNHFYPWMCFTKDRLEEGEIPLWDPYSYCGVPFAANIQSAVFFPLNLLIILLPVHVLFKLTAFTKLFIGGFFAYLFAKKINLNHFSSIVVMESFTFCGFLILWLNHPHVSVAVFLPALLYFSERSLKNLSLPNFIALSLLFVLQFLAGHPETSLHVVTAVILYIIFRLLGILFSKKGVKIVVKMSLFLLGVGILAILLSGIQLIPFVEYLDHSAVFHKRKGPIGAHGFRRPYLAMATIVMPYAFGSPIGIDNEFGRIYRAGTFIENNGGYVGIMMLISILFALPLLKKNKFVRIFFIMSIIAFGFAYGLPIFSNILKILPLFNVSANRRFLLILAFSFCVLGGLGIEGFLSFITNKRRFFKLTIILIILAVIFSIPVIFSSHFISYGQEFIKEKYEQDIGEKRHTKSLGYWYKKIKIFYSNYFRFSLMLLVFDIIILLSICLYRWGGVDLKFIKFAIIVIIAVDLFLFGIGFNLLIKKEYVYPETRSIKLIKRDKSHFRIFPLEYALMPNSAVFYKMQEIRGSDAIVNYRYYKYLKFVGFKTKGTGHPVFRFSNYDSKLIDLLNVKYILSDKPIQSEKFEYIGRPDLFVYKNKNFVPRAYVSSDVKVIRDDEAVLEFMKSDNFIPGKTVVLQNETDYKKEEITGSFCEIKQYKRMHVVLEASMKGTGFLALTDTNYPGWKVYVDGKEEKIQNANYLFRAVKLEKGEHKVEFKYEPVSFKIGILMTTISSLLLFLLSCIAIFRRFRNGKDSSCNR